MLLSVLLAMGHLAVPTIPVAWSEKGLEGEPEQLPIAAGMQVSAGVRDDANDRTFLIANKGAGRVLLVFDRGVPHDAPVPDATHVSLPYQRGEDLCIAICSTKYPPSNRSFGMGSYIALRPETKLGDVAEFKLTNNYRLEPTGKKYKDFTDLSDELAPGLSKPASKAFMRTELLTEIFSFSLLHNAGHDKTTVAPAFPLSMNGVLSAAGGGFWVLPSWSLRYATSGESPRSDDLVLDLWPLQAKGEYLRPFDVVEGGSKTFLVAVDSKVNNRFLTVEIVKGEKELKPVNRPKQVLFLRLICSY